MGGNRKSNSQRGESQELFGELAAEMRAVRVRLQGILQRIRILEQENQNLRERLHEAEDELSFATHEKDILAEELERCQQCQHCQSNRVER